MARPSFCPGKSLELGRVWGELAFFGVFGEPRESPNSAVLQVLLIRGDDRSRTGVDGFAGRCVATPPRRQEATQAYRAAARIGRRRLSNST